MDHVVFGGNTFGKENLWKRWWVWTLNLLRWEEVFMDVCFACIVVRGTV